MDHYGKHRDGVGRFKPGHPGSKPNGIAAALRRLVDPDAIASYLLSVIADEEASTKDRLTAASLVMDRIDGRAVSVIAMHAQIASTAPKLPQDWDQLDQAQRVAWVQAFRARGTLALAAAPSGEDEPE